MVIKLRKASSMIELVIAIVIMGIAVMTLPLMLERVQENNAFAMQQEAILAAKTQLGDMITYPWDENSLKNNVVAVLDTQSASYQREVNTTRRIGHVKQDKRRKFFSNETNASVIGTATNNITDIADFDTDVAVLNKLNAADADFAGSLDYRFDFNMTTSVRYIDDTGSPTNFIFPDTNISTTSNIKMITVTLQGDNISTFKLRAYSSNIGESELLRRNYP